MHRTLLQPTRFALGSRLGFENDSPDRTGEASFGAVIMRVWFIDKGESSHAGKALLNVVGKKLGY
jgi:hypothetical protein